MIIRIFDARKPGETGSSEWWAQARKLAAAGKAPHGLHQLLLDEHVPHIDVFPHEAVQVWDWCEKIPGWVTDGRKQLTSEPLDSTKSATVYLSDESLVKLRQPTKHTPS